MLNISRSSLIFSSVSVLSVHHCVSSFMGGPGSFVQEHLDPPGHQGHEEHTKDVGAAQVLATGKTAGAETDIKYAIIGTAVGIAISAGFLALKFCMIRKHMFDNDSSDLRSTNVGFNGKETVMLNPGSALS
ncbi:hypothetical protein G4228_010700 [Cervus hanglu yarkandensis]|nr:hypothetical protein G4228_010700 [Cervus hanglu yarkandensis]